MKYINYNARKCFYSCPRLSIFLKKELLTLSFYAFVPFSSYSLEVTGNVFDHFISSVRSLTLSPNGQLNIT